MTRHRVSFEIDKPDVIAVTQEQFEEWLRYSYGVTPQIAIDNPLADIEPVPIRGTFRVEPA